jgi:hypothetical protein
MDSYDYKYKREADNLVNALRDIFDPSDPSIFTNPAISSNAELLKRIASEFELINTVGDCDAFQFCKDIKKLAEITAKVPGLAFQSTSLFEFHHFLAKEGRFLKTDKYKDKDRDKNRDRNKGSHGIPCMNMRTGLIYIS